MSLSLVSLVPTSALQPLMINGKKMNINFIAAGVVIGFLAGYIINGWRYDAKIATMVADNATETATAVEVAMQQTVDMQRTKDAALRKANDQIKRNNVAADNARSELIRLHEQQREAAAAMSTATREALNNYTTTLSTVFGECTTSLEAMATKADGHATDSLVLSNSWPK